MIGERATGHRRLGEDAEQLPAAFAEAFDSGNAEHLDRLYDDPGVLVPGPGHPVTGEARAAADRHPVVVGSRAYGLETEESDADRRGVFAAPVPLFWRLDKPPMDEHRDRLLALRRGEIPRSAPAPAISPPAPGRRSRRAA
ncbi:DNA polymerase beta superfamily protein [Planomonospora algeriensis]